MYCTIRYNSTSKLSLTAQPSLTSSVVFPVCPPQQVIFTCTASGALIWRVTTTPMSTFVQVYAPGSPNMPATLGSGDTQFQAVLTSGSTAMDVFTSTLTTTAHTALDGTVVECAASESSEFQTVTLSVTSKSCFTMQTCLNLHSLPSSPASPHQSYHHGGWSDCWHHLSYSYSTVGSQYWSR